MAAHPQKHKRACEDSERAIIPACKQGLACFCSILHTDGSMYLYQEAVLGNNRARRDDKLSSIACVMRHSHRVAMPRYATTPGVDTVPIAESAVCATRMVAKRQIHPILKNEATIISIICIAANVYSFTLSHGCEQLQIHMVKHEIGLTARSHSGQDTRNGMLTCENVRGSIQAASPYALSLLQNAKTGVQQIQHARCSSLKPVQRQSEPISSGTAAR